MSGDSHSQVRFALRAEEVQAIKEVFADIQPQYECWAQRDAYREALEHLMASHALLADAENKRQASRG